MKRQQALEVRKKLKREINRADILAWQNDELKADSKLDAMQRLNAAHRTVLATETRKELQDLLDELEEAMSDR